VRVGVSLTSAYTVSDPRQGAAWMIERAAAARRADLDSLFVGDHHATPGKYYQNVPMLGRLLAEWSDKPAGCLFLLPLWNPVLLAEQVGTLAAIARGRFILQCGLGDGDAQFRAMGAQLKSRAAAFEESLLALRRLLVGESVTASGLFSFDQARIGLVPADPVEIWIGATAPPAIDRAARLGDAWLAAPGLTPERARETLALYRARCLAATRTPTAVAIRRDVYVGESEADAKATLSQAVAAGYRGFDPAALVAGTVAQVVTRFRELETMGYTDVIVRHLTNDEAKTLGSFARLAEVRALVQRPG
jgi:alkanesulfonate monooxygenase SsuD/methylene tetrahydromethanopterin reductase-like flavin-dependent oxidoreductase (luciferase family)